MYIHADEFKRTKADIVTTHACTYAHEAVHLGQQGAHMSRHTEIIEAGIQTINEGLEVANARGQQFDVNVQGRPSLHVHSLEPLAVERFGAVFNKGPKLLGTFALSGMVALYAPRDEAVIFNSVIGVGRDLYGYPSGSEIYTTALNYVMRNGFSSNRRILDAKARI